MQVVLIQNVPSLGQKGSLQEVKPGYARNFLLKTHLAVLPFDPQAKEMIGSISKEKDSTRKANTESVQKINNLQNQKIIFKVKVNKKDRLFKKIHAKDIAKKLNIEENLITIDPLEKLGEYEISLVKGDHKAKVLVVIEKER